MRSADCRLKRATPAEAAAKPASEFPNLPDEILAFSSHLGGGTGGHDEAKDDTTLWAGSAGVRRRGTGRTREHQNLRSDRPARSRRCRPAAAASAVWVCLATRVLRVDRSRVSVGARCVGAASLRRGGVGWPSLGSRTPRLVHGARALAQAVNVKPTSCSSVQQFPAQHHRRPSDISSQCPADGGWR